MTHDIINFTYITISSFISLLFIYAMLNKSNNNIIIYDSFIRLFVILIILFFSHNFFVSFFLLFILCLATSNNNKNIAGILILSILVIPAIEKSLYFGSVKLISVSLSDAASLAALLSLIIRGGVSRPSRISDLSVVALLLIFVLIDSRGTEISNIARVLLQKSLDLFVPYWVISRSIKSNFDIKSFNIYLIVSGCVLSSMVIMESLLGWAYFRGIMINYGLDPMWHQVKWRDGFMRASGPFLESTSMAFALVFFALAAWNFRSIFRGASARYAVFIFICVGIFMCQSRNAWLGIGIGLISSEAFRMLAKPATKNWLPVFASLLIIIPSSVFIFGSQKISSSSDESSSTVEYRSRLLSRGIEESSKNVLLGDNKESVTANMQDMIQGEKIIDFVNSYLYLVLFSGLIGLLIFITIILSIPVRCAGNIKSNLPKDRLEVSSYLFSISTSFTQMLLFTFFGGRILVLIIAIIALLGCIERIRPGISISTNSGRRRRFSIASASILPAAPDLFWRKRND